MNWIFDNSDSNESELGQQFINELDEEIGWGNWTWNKGGGQFSIKIDQFWSFHGENVKIKSFLTKKNLKISQF